MRRKKQMMKTLVKRQKAIKYGIVLAMSSIWLSQSNRASAQSGEKAVLVAAQHEIKTTRYLVTGDKEGRVKFSDFQRKVSNHFQMDAGKWARELFVLDDGKTVGASQIDHSVFWNTSTGKEIGRVLEQVYGFSHDQKHFIAQNGRGKVSIYEYPSLKRVAQLQPPFTGGVGEFLFSPNDQYCAIAFETALPAPEATYPFVQALKNIIQVQLYCLNPVGEVSNFAPLHLTYIGAFTADSSAYTGSDTLFDGRNWITGPWRFDLKTFKVEAVKTAKK